MAAHDAPHNVAPATYPECTHTLVRFLPDHRAANKPMKEIEERYYWAAKLLFDIGGTGQGEDSFTGMQLELIAERNPYFLGPRKAFPVRFLQDGAPVARFLVRVLPKSDSKSVQRLWNDEAVQDFYRPARIGPMVVNRGAVLSAETR